jgi:hypothetical protein
VSSPALRSAVLRLVVSVIALDAVAISIYYLADIALQPASIRYPFFAVWILLTLALVLSGLQRVRLARVRRR